MENCYNRERVLILLFTEKEHKEAVQRWTHDYKSKDGYHLDDETVEYL